MDIKANPIGKKFADVMSLIRYVNSGGDILVPAESIIGEDQQVFHANDVEAVYRISSRLILQAHTLMPQVAFARALKRCESPIEQLMMGALIALALRRNLEVRVQLESIWDISSSCATDLVSLLVVPQYCIDKYRVDFLVRATLSGVREASAPKAPAGEGFFSREINIAIECDGHSFHERTPEQAMHDRSRDRLLQQLDFKVFRFTGKEINSNCWGCADSVLDYLEKQCLKEL